MVPEGASVWSCPLTAWRDAFQDGLGPWCGWNNEAVVHGMQSVGVNRRLTASNPPGHVDQSAGVPVSNQVLPRETASSLLFLATLAVTGCQPSAADFWVAW